MSATFLPLPCPMWYKTGTMRTYIIKVIALSITFLASAALYAQDSTVQSAVTREFYEESLRNKIIPDKVFEVGVVLLLVFIVTNSVITVFKVNAERRLKEKALDKGISEPTLIELFRQDKNLVKNNYLKWFLILCSLGISLIYVHTLDQYVSMSSGYLSVGFIALFMSIAFLIYYRIIRKQK